MARWTRNEIIDEAHRKLGAVNESGTIDNDWLLRAARTLGAIVREESNKSARVRELMYASQFVHLRPNANGGVFTWSVAFGLPANVEDVTSAVWRRADGTDVPLLVINEKQWNVLEDKDELGEPTRVYFRNQIDRVQQQVIVHPTPATVTACSGVLGSDGLEYFAIQDHTSKTANKPTSGRDWELFWARDISAAGSSAWVDATAYTAGELLRLTYRRQLSEMVNATDNPDFPEGWDRYLGFRLAYDLAPHFGITLDERVFLKREYQESGKDLFGGSHTTGSDHHNRATFF